MWYLPTSMMGWDDTTLGVYRYRCGAGDEREEGKRGAGGEDKRGARSLAASRFRRTCDPSAPSIYGERREGQIFALLEKEGVRERGR